MQFILDEYSCAAYVVEYVSKSSRGICNVYWELIKLHEEHVLLMPMSDESNSVFHSERTTARATEGTGEEERYGQRGSE